MKYKREMLINENTLFYHARRNVKRLLFLDKDLPSNQSIRDEIILKALGAGNARGVDGMGTLDPLSNKIAIIRASTTPGIDIDYLFLQADLKRMILDDSINCGNIIAAVAPYAVESGLIKVGSGERTIMIRNLNTNVIVESTIATKNGNVVYEGDIKIDGVPGTGAPIALNFKNSIGSVTEKLFPTGEKLNVINGIYVSCIDVSVPLIIIRANELGIIGDDPPEVLNSNKSFLRKIELIRKEVAYLANLGDVSNKVIPKIAIVSKPRKSGTITSRYSNVIVLMQ
ncbi:PrpF domain-containing protein [Bacillus wiedmannii]|uniref:PrpF domain-containing protein n=2 Tax=Bacillaceae TaxID=186817 RepID=UPI00211D8326|nr:PrpF domain-containing protein [Bacillus wiedmannii]